MEAAAAEVRASEPPFLCGGEVAEGVRRFDDGIVNWYLLEDADELALVDAGLPPDWSMLTTALGTLGRRLTDVRAIVLTHAHVDHIGFAARLQREAGTAVLVHEADERLAREPTAIAESERSPLLYLRHAATRELVVRALLARAPLAKGIDRVTPFADGEPLDGVPGSPVPIHVPGHTDGHCALHLPDRGVLFTGDALVTRDPYTGRTGPRTVAAAATKDTALALASLERLGEANADVLLPGHGDPWHGQAIGAVRGARAVGRS